MRRLLSPNSDRPRKRHKEAHQEGMTEVSGGTLPAPPFSVSYPAGSACIVPAPAHGASQTASACILPGPLNGALPAYGVSHAASARALPAPSFHFWPSVASQPIISTLTGTLMPGMPTVWPMMYRPEPPMPAIGPNNNHLSYSNAVSTGLSEATMRTPSARDPVTKTMGQYRRLSIHETVEAARIAMRSVDECVYIFKYRYGRQTKTSVYECASHENCKMQFRLNPFEEPSTGVIMISLECRGNHSSVRVARKQSGIHEALKPEVDALIAGGAGPKKVLKILCQKYQEQPQMMQKLPSDSQIRSRKSFKTAQQAKQWEIKSFADLCEWSGTRACTDETSFFGQGGFVEEGDADRFLSQPYKYQNEAIVLDSFTHDFTENGKQRTSFGLVLTSRRVFRNVFYAIDGQDADGVFAAADGTYKLHYGNWTLVAFGSYRTRYTSKAIYSKNFVPWAYMFVRTEHEFAYERLFVTVVKYAKLFFKRDLVVKFGSLDHSDCIANAYEAVWPGVVLLDCYSHVSRKCRENKARLSDKTFFSSNVEVNIKQLHQARSPEHFDALSQLCLRFWRGNGECEYADWFEKVYLHQRWKRWFTVSAIPGILPSQNALESHNNVIKKCGVAEKKAKTGVVLNESVPGILAVVAQDTANASFGHCCEGPLNSTQVSTALSHVEPIGHFIKRRKKNNRMVIQSILFNASAYMKTPKGKLAEPVTSVRVNRYLDSKTGKINAADSVTRIDLHYLSLHEVELTAAPERYTAFKFTLQHTISFETIQEIRSLYRCDCKSFWNTGWMCSHVIAAMAIMKQLSLKAATSLIPVKKASGGQRKVRGALFVDDPTNKTFSKGNLLNKLQKDPLHCLGWRVGSEFTFVEDDGTSEDEFVVGFIRGVRYRHGIAFWCVKFSDKEEKFYEIEEVIDLIITARKEGIDVTNGMKLTAADVWC